MDDLVLEHTGGPMGGVIGALVKSVADEPPRFVPAPFKISLTAVAFAMASLTLRQNRLMARVTSLEPLRRKANGTASGTVGPIPFGPFMFSDFGQAVGFGDLYPQATPRWNRGVDNYMLYVTGDIPVGLYNSSDLANIGIGHGAIDAGGAYTYFNPQTGREFSVTTGMTYNFINPSTQYQNGIDAHLDWGASQFLTKQFQIGAVGYVYQQLTCDSGSGDKVGCFESRVLGIGPQVGFIFPMETPFGIKQAYLNIRAYAEFDHQNRAQGGDLWVSLTISPPAPTPPPAAQPMLHK
jgi:outer membrane putative beta-barrel porin/alpha-amylase